MATEVLSLRDLYKSKAAGEIELHSRVSRAERTRGADDGLEAEFRPLVRVAEVGRRANRMGRMICVASCGKATPVLEAVWLCHTASRTGDTRDDAD